MFKRCKKLCNISPFLKKLTIEEQKLYFDERDTFYKYKGKIFLDFCVSELTFYKYPNLTKKQLKLISLLYISSKNIIQTARNLGIDYFFINYELESTEERDKRNQYLFNSIHRIIGFIYEKKGLIPAFEFINEHIFNEIDVTNIINSFHSVHDLTNLCKENNQEIIFKESHNNNKYKCDVFIDGKLAGENESLTPKLAKEKACNDVLLKFYTETVFVDSPLEKYIHENKI